MHSPWRLKVGLALGGGAARGLAHVGVLRALLREGLPVDLVVGTSMGAVVGGAYAATQDIAGVEGEIRRMLSSPEFERTRMGFLREMKRQRGGLLYSVTRLVRQGIVYGMSTMRSSFVTAEEFAASMEEILPQVNIEDLPVTFGCVAVDLEAGEEVVLTRGPLRDAAAASAAIPGLLPPRRLNGRLLVDGGWVDKIPVVPAFRLGADVVIAVDISADLENARSYTRGFDVVLRANAIKDAVLVGMQRRLADVVIAPAVRHVHWADFDSVDYSIEAGDAAAVAAVPRIREILHHERWRSLIRPSLNKRLVDLYLASPDIRFAVD